MAPAILAFIYRGPYELEKLPAPRGLMQFLQLWLQCYFPQARSADFFFPSSVYILGLPFTNPPLAD